MRSILDNAPGLKDTVNLTLIYYLQDSAAWYENEIGLAILDFCKTIGIARDILYNKTQIEQRI